MDTLLHELPPLPATLTHSNENMPDSVGDILRSAGRDVALARSQALAGVDDDRLLSSAAAEGRALVSFDLHFSDIRRHRPG